jgi:histidinol-phosphate aminotransferase
VRQVSVDLGPDFGWPFGAGQGMPADGVSLFFITNPNAPTSILYPRDAVRAFCETFPGVVLLDEAYVDFSKEHCMDLALELDNVLVMRTLSKSYSLAGVRLGYVVGPAPLVEALLKIKDSYNVNAVSQELAMAALSDVQYMRDTVEKIKRTRGRLAGALEALGYRVFPSETNFLWVEPKGITAEALFERLREQRIFIRYFPGEKTGRFVRITIGTDAEIDKLLGVMTSTVFSPQSPVREED